MSETKTPIELAGLTQDEVKNLLASWGEKPYRAKQLWVWLHVKLVDDAALMTNLSKILRARLAESCSLRRLSIKDHQVSQDGTEKWLLELADGQVIETVFIPESDRGTLCISSQAGCTLSCSFCCTGTQGFARNLTAAEIVQQVLLARAELQTRDKKITNLVLMGMGEPLYNTEAVSQAVRIIIDGDGLGIGTRKLTLSTVGVIPQLKAVEELGVNLAISLHAVRDEVRDELVPLNKKYNLAALREALLDFRLKSGRRITWEYVMLDGVNDSDDDRRALIHYLRGIPSKVNLIPFNPWPGSAYRRPPREVMVTFKEKLHKAGVAAIIRESRGADIAAACGQLKGELSGARARN